MSRSQKVLSDLAHHSHLAILLKAWMCSRSKMGDFEVSVGGHFPWFRTKGPRLSPSLFPPLIQHPPEWGELNGVIPPPHVHENT